MKKISPILFLLTQTLFFSHFCLAEKAVFAGGSFWCTESDFEKLEGVTDVTAGFTGGFVKNPSYEQVSNTETGHFEAVLVDYDARKISYKQLLDHFWKSIDPFDAEGQFCNKGPAYRSAIFPLNEEQMQMAESSKISLQRQFGNSHLVVTRVVSATTFYPAEEQHQDFYKKNPVRYNYNRWDCGRDKRLKEIWVGKANSADSH